MDDHSNRGWAPTRRRQTVTRAVPIGQRLRAVLEMLLERAEKVRGEEARREEAHSPGKKDSGEGPHKCHTTASRGLQVSSRRTRKWLMGLKMKW